MPRFPIVHFTIPKIILARLHLQIPKQGRFQTPTPSKINKPNLEENPAPEWELPDNLKTDYGGHSQIKVPEL